MQESRKYGNTHGDAEPGGQETGQAGNEGQHGPVFRQAEWIGTDAPRQADPLPGAQYGGAAEGQLGDAAGFEADTGRRCAQRQMLHKSDSLVVSMAYMAAMETTM